jgi:ubiquinone/menaquinone biosynthesis C-methylase UbiE
MLREIYYKLPLQLRKWVRRIYFLPKDIFSSKSSEIPSEGKNFIGSGDFVAVGEEFFNYFINFELIHPESKILEIGCGMGRMALPLTKYLNAKGHYLGMDIVKEGIDWCNHKIAPNDHRFEFLHQSIYNKLYNPSAKVQTTDYKFPIENNSIDFVFLTSVFTHLLPQDVEHYLEEIKRVLKNDQNLFATFFILNEEVEVYKKSSKISFKHKKNGYALMNENIPEANIAYDENYLHNLYKKNGLEITKIYYGSWCGRSQYTSFQDIIIAKKI